MSATHRPTAAVVLAAGEGKRMRSATPKVLHKMLGRTLLGHVLAAVEPLEPDHVRVVVGHGKEAVTGFLESEFPSAESVIQAQQLGTGHAVRLALANLPATGTVLVVCGDTPLLRSETLQRLVAHHDDRGSAATVLTADVPDPAGYGRVIRDAGGGVQAIVEHGDADIEQRRVREINSGIYAFDLVKLRDALGDLSRENSQGEEYLTDVVGGMRSRREQVAGVAVDNWQEILGVNDRVQLAAAREVMRRRVNEYWMRAGVSIIDPAATMIGVHAQLEADAVIHPGTLIEGKTTVAAGAEIGPNSQIVDSTVAGGALVKYSVVDRASIGPNAVVGPFSYLRPGTDLAAGTRVGAFVETKNAVVGPGSKVPHLSYVGDAEIGENSNIGAATVFVNYDGVNKHRTVIGDEVRIGSDTMLIAPVEIGDGAYTAAGSVITDDVPPGAMGVGRARQRTILGWVARKRPGSSSAQAAAAAESGPQQPSADVPVDNGTTAPTSSTGDDPAEGDE